MSVRLPWITAAHLAEHTPERVPWITVGYAAERAITELVASIKAGKSTLLAYLALAVLTDGHFLNAPVLAGPVLWITEERRTTFRRLLERAGLLTQRHLHILSWHEARAQGVSWPAMVEDARQLAQEVAAPLLIVDTLGRLAGLAGDDENSSAAATAMVPLEEAAQDGLAVVYGRHGRKAGGEPEEAGRGSTSIGGAADIILQITKAGASHGPNVRRLRSASRFEETPVELLIELDAEAHEYRALGSSAAIKADAAEAAILAELRQGERRDTELRALDGLGYGTVQRALDDLLSRHLIQRLGTPRSRKDPTRWRIISSTPTPPVDENRGRVEGVSSHPRPLPEGLDERNGRVPGRVTATVTPSVSSPASAERREGM